MPAKIVIMDGAKGTGQYAGVSSAGELIVSAFGSLINQSVFQSLTSANAGINFFGPIPGKIFLISTIVMTTTATAVVQIYETSTPSSAVVDKLLFKITLTSTVQSATIFTLPLPFGGRIPVSEGKYVNVQTDVATVNVNLIGYYHNTERSVR